MQEKYTLLAHIFLSKMLNALKQYAHSFFKEDLKFNA